MDDPARTSKLKQKIDNYTPVPATIGLIDSTPIVLLVGVSGAGKGTIKQKLLDSGKYHHIVSHTTRAPRENNSVMEQDGLEYHFIDIAKAEAMLDDGAFVEAKIYSGNVYGTSVAEIQAAHDENRIALTDIEVQGVAEYKEISRNVKAVFVLPPSYEVWQERLAKRYAGKADNEDMKRRMHTAKAELREALDKDYFRFVINDGLNAAAEAVDAIAHDAPAGKESETARQLASDLLAKL